MNLYVEPVASPWDDLPEGLALLMAAQREGSAADLLTRAHEGLRMAQAYADHASSLCLSLGTASYADVARAAGISRQGARKRYGATVEALGAELDVAVQDLPALMAQTVQGRR